MKKLFLIAALVLGFGFGAAAQTPVKSDTTIVFNEPVHDFGEIVQNSGPQTYTFEFTNTGAEAIIIQNVTASCGCTTPGWTKEPVAPGQKGEVKATYNPGAVMPFDKTLSVYSNAKPGFIVLHIKGKVVAAQ